MDESTQRIIVTIYFALAYANGEDWTDRANDALEFFADEQADPRTARFLRTLAAGASSLLTDEYRPTIA